MNSQYTMDYEKKNDKLDFMKIKNHWFLKDTTKRMKRQGTDQQKIFAEHASDKDLNQEYIKIAYSSITRQAYFKSQAKDMNRHFKKDDM